MSILIDPTTVEPNVVTRDGAPVMLFTYLSKQPRSYLGMFYNKSEWVACSWNKDGSYICKESKSGMDLIMLNKLLKDSPKEAA